jgi:DNA-binding MarR family transcriptional regulator
MAGNDTRRSPSQRGNARQNAVAPSVALSVLQHLRELYRVSQQHFQRVEVRCGLSGAQLWALSELKARPGSTISELASTLSVHLSTASNLLDRLEDKKLVRRRRGPPDQRVVRVIVTPEGENMLRLAPKPAEGIIQDALQRMPRDALVRLDRDLETLLRRAKVRDQRAAMKHLAEP